MADVKHDTKRSETKLVGEVRIAYPYHQEKRTKSAGGALLDKPHYDAVGLLPKLGTAETCPNYKILSDMAMEAAVKAWGAWPDGGKWPIQDGDIPHPHKPKPGEKALTAEQVAERNKWRTGSWVFEVANYLDGPKVTVLQNGVLQEVPSQNVAGHQTYKSGDWGYLSMNSYSFQNKTWGVNFGYEGVAYTRTGDLIGGGPKSAAQMFAGIPGATVGASAPSAPQPPAAPGPAAPAAPQPPAAAAPAAPAGLPPLPPGVPPAATLPPLPPQAPRPPGM